MIIIRAALAALSFGVLAAPLAAAAQSVWRPALVDPSMPVTFSDAAGRLQLTGYLYRPEGKGPFPALVLLHGCGGISPNIKGWAETLRRWGYVALLVDSLGPRGETHVCDRFFRADPLDARMPDAYGAQTYLARQAFVDVTQIGVMGWSHGGTTTLYVVDDVYLDRLRPKPFTAAIAFYPACLMRLQKLNAPLLILIGEADDWHAAARCRTMELEPATPHGMTLRVYPGAHHGFDSLRPLDSLHGHTVGREPEAAAKAEEEVRRFLTQHLLSKD